jgi:hypothetical protein
VIKGVVDDRVQPRPAVGEIGEAAARVDAVIALAAVDLVDTGLAEQRVGSGAAVDHVVAAVPVDTRRDRRVVLELVVTVPQARGDPGDAAAGRLVGRVGDAPGAHRQRGRGVAHDDGAFDHHAVDLRRPGGEDQPMRRGDRHRAGERPVGTTEEHQCAGRQAESHRPPHTAPIPLSWCSYGGDAAVLTVSRPVFGSCAICGPSSH